jgi:hypothetical protein
VVRGQVDFLFGLARNARLNHIHVDLAWAEHEAERSGRPARRFADFRWRTRDSWSRRRRVVAMAEWMPGRGEAGANPRFVVTSLAAAEIGARALYERGYAGSRSPTPGPHGPPAAPSGSAPQDRAQVTRSVRRIRIVMALACPCADVFALAHTRLCR